MPEFSALSSVPFAPRPDGSMVPRAGSAPWGAQYHRELPHGVWGSGALADPAWGSLAAVFTSPVFYQAAAAGAGAPPASEQRWWQAWQASLLHRETLLPSMSRFPDSCLL